MKYVFESLKNDLKMGREIDFFYKSEKYGISHGNSAWYLSRYKDGYFQEFKSYNELLEKSIILGNSLKDIWSDVEIDYIY